MHKGMIAALIVACVIVLVTITVAIASGGDKTRTCPDGKQLVAVQVTTGKGTLSVEQSDASKLPPGSKFEAGGGGAVVTSDARSATVHGDGPLKLEVTCR